MAQKAEVLIDTPKPPKLWVMQPSVSRLYDNLSRYLELLCNQTDIWWDRSEISETGARCEINYWGRSWASVYYNDNTVRLLEFHGIVYWKISDMSIISTWLDEVIIDRKRSKGVVPSLLSMARVKAGKVLVDRPDAIGSMPNTLRCPGQPSKRLRFWSTESYFKKYRSRW